MFRINNTIAKRAFSFVPMLLIMITIFSFSSQPAVESTKTSSGVIVKLLDFLEENQMIHLDSKERVYWEDKLTYPVRKVAHMTEYGILAVSVLIPSWGLVRDTGKRRKSQMIFVSWMATVTYASTDEFHQLFVPGRSGQFIDIMIDGMGALIGIGIYLLISRMVRRWRMKHEYS